LINEPDTIEGFVWFTDPRIAVQVQKSSRPNGSDVGKTKVFIDEFLSGRPKFMIADF
jgi:hypothetical protein